jgi:hypothetical protein
LQANHPEVVNKIYSDLKLLRSAGTHLDYNLIRAIIYGTIQAMAPELLSGDRPFLVSRRYIQTFMSVYLDFSWRKTTKAAGKVPDDWEYQGFLLSLRICSSISTYDTPPELVINADQTGVHLLMLGGMTWHPRGETQVPAIGIDEKRQVTLMLSFSAAGNMLPFQIISGGKTEKSLPSANARKEGEDAGFLFSVSGAQTHWSNLTCMQEVLMNFHSDSNNSPCIVGR